MKESVEAEVVEVCDAEGGVATQASVDVIVASCVHADAQGLCQNESLNGCGAKCCRCACYQPRGERRGLEAAAPVVVDVRSAGTSDPTVVVDVRSAGTSDPTVVGGDVLGAPRLPVKVGHNVVQMDAAKALEIQFKRCDYTQAAAIVECCKFGAMLEQIDSFCTHNRRRPECSGQSLKSWLAENCPAIKYDRAMKYRYCAQGLKKMVGMKDERQLLPYISREKFADDGDENIRLGVMTVLESVGSLSELRSAANQVNPLKGTVGVAKGRVAIPESEKAAMAAAAMRELCGSLQAFIFEGTQCSLLTTDELNEFANNLKLYAKKVVEIAYEG